MKHFLTTLIVLFLAANVFSQKTEFSLRLNSGVASFSGESAHELTYMLYDIVNEDGHTNNPYGTNYGVSYGVSGNLDRILDAGLKIGADLGFEMLRSQADVTFVTEHGTGVNRSYDSEGHVNMNSGFINLFPHVGYRLKFSELNVDIDGGADLGYAVDITEKAHAETEERNYETSLDRKTIDFDVRPRIQLGLSGYNFGGYVGYSMGITNYLSDFTEGKEGAYNSIIRAGLFYKWKLRGKDHLRWRRRR